jgi:phosphoadenosine phosphosulfate reductase
MTADTATLRAVADDAAARFAQPLKGAPPEETTAEVLQWATDTFGRRWVVTAAMADTVLAHLASRIAPGVDVVFLDTGYHFAETLGTRNEVELLYDIRLVNVTPVRTVAEQDAELGPRLFERDPNRCCALRKVEPLDRALSNYDAWASGARREESPTRANIPLVGWDSKRDKVKMNPLALWTEADLLDYTARHGIVVNPLLNDGYPSIGCAPCTRRVAPGEHVRSGRWPNSDKTECGIHL